MQRRTSNENGTRRSRVGDGHVGAGDGAALALQLRLSESKLLQQSVSCEPELRRKRILECVPVELCQSVMAGLDPAIHPLGKKFLRRMMDPRVKPAGDACGVRTAESRRPEYVLGRIEVRDCQRGRAVI